MVQLEREIEEQLRRMVAKRGGQCLKWVCPGWAGVPDRIILLPGGRVIFAETKRPKGGHLSALQEWWQKRLQSLDFVACVVWNESDVNALALRIEYMLGEEEA